MGRSSRPQLANITLPDTPPVRASVSRRLLLPAVERAKEYAEGKGDSHDKPLTGQLSWHMEQAVLSLLQEFVKGRVVGSLEVTQGRRSDYSQKVKIGIKARGRILLIDLADVAAVEAQGNYALLRRQSNSYLVRASISELAEQLESLDFVRVHRSALINASWVEELRPRGGGEYILLIKGGREYTVSRTYRCNLNRLARAWIGTDLSRGSAVG